MKLIGEPKRAPVGPQPLAGKTFVITGELDGDVARRRAGEDSRRSARKVTGSVSKKTNALIVGSDPARASSRKRRHLAVARRSMKPRFLRAYNE